jgi:hypothetical protein
MKNLLPIIAACIISNCFVSIPVIAGEVSKEKATTLAVNFFSERYVQYFDLSADGLKVESVLLVREGDFPVYYAVNFTEGFILIAARDEVFPVLAYSFSGHYRQPTNQQNFMAWMGQYAGQIQNAASGGVALEETHKTWEKYTDPGFGSNTEVRFRDVEPLLTSTWNQGKYYNQMCPADPSGVAGHCVTGCVATAMGQLAYYFRHPETGMGSYSYNHPTYGTISANFGNTTYHWEEMVNNVDETNLAVAELLFHLGVAVDMVYGPQSSGMYNHKAAYALRTYFKYSPETQYVFRDSTSMDWDSLLVTHLDQKIPMYYAGWSQPDVSGHAFVVDGYQGDHFYHFNWGWGGSYDGYFYTDDLSPGGSNFNLAQELIIHCFPDTVNYTYPGYCSGENMLTALHGTIDDGSGPCYDYLSGAQCSWLIDPQNEMDSITGITLSFQRFALENQNDFLRIFDGGDDNAPLIGEFSGNDLPGTISSSGNKLFLLFQSDDSGAAPGFFASYLTERPEWCSGMTVMTEQSGELSDGSGTFYYENNTICMWQINPPGAGQVTLHFTKFQTQPDFDVVKVYDPSGNVLLAEISGMYDPPDLPDPVVSASGKMFITFTTDGDTRADGWDAWYATDLVQIDEQPLSDGMEIFPNPASDLIVINVFDAGDQPLTIEILDCQGKTIFNHMMSKTSEQIDVSSLKNGLYFIRGTGKAIHYSTKIIINR